MTDKVEFFKLFNLISIRYKIFKKSEYISLHLMFFKKKSFIIPVLY